MASGTVIPIDLSGSTTGSGGVVREVPANTKNTEKPKIPNELRQWFRKVSPDPIGRSNADILLDYIEMAMTSGGGAAFSKIMWDGELINYANDVVPIEESTLIVINRDDWADATNTFTIDTRKIKPFTRFAFVTIPTALTDYWYFKIITRAPMVPTVDMISNVELVADDPNVFKFTIKMAKDFFTSDMIVVTDDTGGPAFTILNSTFYSGYTNAYSSGSAN